MSQLGRYGAHQRCRRPLRARNLKSHRVSNLTHGAHLNQSPIASRPSDRPRGLWPGESSHARDRRRRDQTISLPRTFCVPRFEGGQRSLCLGLRALARGEEGASAKFITDYHFYHLFGTSNNRVSEYCDYGCVRRLRRRAGAGPKRAPGDGRAVVEGLGNR
jgi:hypothetical protein